MKTLIHDGNCSSIPITGNHRTQFYFIDFVYDQYDEDSIKKLIKKNKRVTIIDHHISKERVTKLTQDYSYSINHSGAVLSWMFFHKDKPIPLLLRYIEDGDLWKFKLTDTDSVVTYVSSVDYDFTVWDSIVLDIENDEKRKEYIAKGALMVGYKEEMIKKIIEENKKISLELE